MRNLRCQMNQSLQARGSAVGVRLGAGLVAFALFSACGTSDAEKQPFSPSGSGGGSGGTKPKGDGGTVSSGGSTATGGTAPSGGTTSSGGAPSGDCPTYDKFTLGVHLVLNATWKAGTGTRPGSGIIHIWNRSRFNAAGNQLTGETVSCGTILPEFELNEFGQTRAGDGTKKISVQIPHEAWDAAPMPKFETKGTIDGWNPGSAVQIEPTIAIVALNMPDPNATWPAKSSTFKADDILDPDGDSKKGLTAAPVKDGVYGYPPILTLKTLFGNPRAEKIYLVSRTVVGLKGTIESCETQAGTTEVVFFDSHVVGCKLEGSDEQCDADKTDALDSTRTVHEIPREGGGTFKAKKLADDASCADVRAALPVE